MKKTEQEKLQDDLQEALKSTDKQSEEKLQLILPDSVSGHAVTWHYQVHSQMPLLILISIIAVICLMLYQEERLKAQLKQRTEQLLHDYPGFVSPYGPDAWCRHDIKKKLVSADGGL